jgi:hypothetical protein
MSFPEAARLLAISWILNGSGMVNVVVSVSGKLSIAVGGAMVVCNV